jgi:hypothetical protein
VALIAAWVFRGLWGASGAVHVFRFAMVLNIAVALVDFLTRDVGAGLLALLATGVGIGTDAAADALLGLGAGEEAAERLRFVGRLHEIVSDLLSRLSVRSRRPSKGSTTVNLLDFWRIIAVAFFFGYIGEVTFRQQWRKGKWSFDKARFWFAVLFSGAGVLMFWPNTPGHPPLPWRPAPVAFLGGFGKSIRHRSTRY